MRSKKLGRFTVHYPFGYPALPAASDLMDMMQLYSIKHKGADHTVGGIARNFGSDVSMEYDWDRPGWHVTEIFFSGQPA